MDILRQLFVPYESQASWMSAADVTLKMLIAVLFSGLIGWEREAKDQPAGLRTHIILCIGSTMMTIVSIRVVQDLGGVEPTRIMAQIVSGIGFLGAGAIIRLGMTVRGLTTATTLWAIAGVGMAIGAGYYLPAFIGVISMYAVLHYLENLAVRIQSGRDMHLSVVTDAEPGRVGAIEDLVTDMGIKVRSLRAHTHPRRGTMEVEGLLKLPANVEPGPVVEQLLELDGVRESYLN